MTLRDLFDLNDQLTDDNRFSKEQWEEIINIAFSFGNEWKFDESVENFYTGWLDVDFTEYANLISNIQMGNAESINRFIDDIVNYFRYE